MKIERHPAPESLMSCSAGSMPEALAAVMASHIDLCEHCRRELAVMETIGAALFEQLPPTPVEASSIDANGVEAPVTPSRQAAAGDVPLPLRKYVGTSLKDIRWKWVAPGIWQHRLPLSDGSDASLRLIKVSPGLALPDHGHNGSELTLVLQGSFEDPSGIYRVGDVADMDESNEHAPVAAADQECICLIASEGPMRFNGFLARIVQKLTGF